jgi:hypothetical protein
MTWTQDSESMFTYLRAFVVGISLTQDDSMRQSVRITDRRIIVYCTNSGGYQDLDSGERMK